MRTAAIGFGTLFISFFMFLSMATLMQGASMHEQINAACNEAAYQTQVFLTEENDIVQSDEDLKSIFIAFLKPQLQHPENCQVKFYLADHENMLLDVGVSCSYKTYVADKVSESRRTIIMDDNESEGI